MRHMACSAGHDVAGALLHPPFMRALSQRACAAPRPACSHISPPASPPSLPPQATHCHTASSRRPPSFPTRTSPAAWPPSPCPSTSCSPRWAARGGGRQAWAGRQAGLRALAGVGGSQGRAGRGGSRGRAAQVAGIRAGAHTTQADLNTKSTTTLPRASQPCPHPHPHPHSIPTPTHLPLPLAPQEAASKGIGPADSFRINPKFTDRMRRIRVGGRQGACLPHMHHAERMQSGCSCCAPGVDPSSSNSGVKRPLIQTPPPPRPPASCLRAARRCRCRLWTTARRFRRMWTR